MRIPDIVLNYVRNLVSDPKQKLDQLRNQPSHGLKGLQISVNQTPGDLVGDAPITVSLAQIDALRGQIRQAQQEAAELRLQLEAAKRGDPNGDTSKLERLSRAMLTIVRFAVANLPPSDIPKWPRDSLMLVAEHLPALPEFSVDDETLVAELKLFAQEIEEHELRRWSGGRRANPPPTGAVRPAMEHVSNQPDSVTPPAKRNIEQILREMAALRSSGHRHGPGQRGGPGPCDADCLKCMLEYELLAAQRALGIQPDLSAHSDIPFTVHRTAQGPAQPKTKIDTEAPLPNDGVDPSQR